MARRRHHRPPPTPTPTPTPARAADPPNLDDEANDFPFPGADTIALHDGSNMYGTFGATRSGFDLPFGVTTPDLNVPWSTHGSGDYVGSTSTLGGDALPNGGGDWAEPDSEIWTPGAFYKVTNVGRYYLFYTAIEENSGGRRCVGVAHSTQPFTDVRDRAGAAGVPDEGRPLGNRRRRHRGARRRGLDDLARRPAGAMRTSPRCRQCA